MAGSRFAPPLLRDLRRSARRCRAFFCQDLFRALPRLFLDQHSYGDSILHMETLVSIGGWMGIVAMHLLMLQLVTMGRIPVLERAFGHAALNKFHRIVGYSVGFLLLAHPIFILWGYGVPVVSFITSSDELIQAAIGLLIFVFVIIFTVRYRKR